MFAFFVGFFVSIDMAFHLNLLSNDDWNWKFVQSYPEYIPVLHTAFLFSFIFTSSETPLATKSVLTAKPICRRLVFTSLSNRSLRKQGLSERRGMLFPRWMEVVASRVKMKTCCETAHTSANPMCTQIPSFCV